ncbi:MAG: hypothetical protein A3H98_14765 [Bacteroidetes bacterium RIFCSPLOWO2_02_FULL_36_8]|nr:MAG: hypothetical protein A3H98_14765 [Bacteroidetes bacterium RIFCSPLOWO2_02_FULL_36_8]OFY70094.1 MAG: hypothetical protein A3G23_11685 [Bacteroidetes bacterium RIFCSPLOWO2_12_FULL_37_12]
MKTNHKLLSTTTTLIYLLLTVYCSHILYAIDYISIANGNLNNIAIWSPVGTPGNNDNIIVNHTIDLTSDAQINDIIINGGSVNVGSYSISVSGQISGVAASNFITTSLSKLEIAGNSGAFSFPSGISKLQKLTINRSSGAISDHSLDMDDNVPADSVVLVLTSGILRLSATSKLFLNSHGVKKYIPCSSSSYVEGVVSRNIKKDAGMHYFPVGDGGTLRLMSLEVTTGGVNEENTNECRFYKAIPINYNYIDFAKLPGGITDKYYWTSNRVNGANTRRRLYYEYSDFGALNSAQRIADLLLANNSGVPASNWTTQTTPVNVNDVSKYVEFVNSNASNDNYWTFGSQSAGSPLPIVEIVNLNGKNEDGIVSVEWDTPQEYAKVQFTVESGLNPSNMGFAGNPEITEIKKGLTHYVYRDLGEKFPANFYYRVKITRNAETNDEDYSKTIAVRVESEFKEIKVSEPYPNPSKNTPLQFTALIPEEGTVSLIVYNNLGQVVKEWLMEGTPGLLKFELPVDELEKGTYFYSVKYKLQSNNGKFIKLKNQVIGNEIGIADSTK